MAVRAPHSPLYATGWLHGWRLTFGGEHTSWAGALSTVVEDAESAVFVALYDMTPHDEASLDVWEGTDLGFWNKIRVRISTLNEDVLAWIYVLNDYEGGFPSPEYLAVIANAAEAGGAPSEYVQRLREHPTASAD